MAHDHVPDNVTGYRPTKLDFTGKALTQRNLDKKLAHQSERQAAVRRTKLKQKQTGSNLKSGRTYQKSNDFVEEKAKLPINVEDVLAKPEVTMLDPLLIKKLLPKGFGSYNVQTITDKLNQAIAGMDDVLGEHFRDNCISWINVTKSCKVSLDAYISAAKFVTYKLAGDSNTRAYARTFPERVSRMAQEGMNNEYLNTYANIYAKGKLVTEIHAIALVPTHIMYQDYFHLAVKTQVEIMTDPNVSAKVRSDAATSLMTHLKTPEVKKAELNVNVNESDTIAELRDVLSQLSAKQHTDIIEGQYKVLDVSHHKIISGDNEDDV